MQLPVLKSITDIRQDAKRVFDQVCKKDEIILVTKNNDKVSVILSPDHYQSLIEENETLWEELEMIKSRKATKGEKVYPLKDVLSGKI